jgi:tRNA threonylcarbamoyladenosine biosynthesis protein TsaB
MDTATDYGSVAVGEPGVVAAELLFTRRRHASGLMPAIVQVLQLADRDLVDLSGIIVADGPGSFTGLRIGFSTAKGIVREHPSASLYTVPSLLNLAYGARHLGDGAVAALYDALRGDVFGAVYLFEQRSVVCEVAPTLGTIEALQKQCSTPPAIVVGEGSVLHRESVRSWIGRDPIGPPDMIPRASWLLDLLSVDGAAARVEDPASFEPEYGRLAEAQVRLEKAGRDPREGR